MKFNVNTTLEYNVTGSSTLILSIHALNTGGQTVIQESFITEPAIKVEELHNVGGENRLVRLIIPGACNLKIDYNATVDNALKTTDHKKLKDIYAGEFAPEILPFLYPSRYCQSDKLYRLAEHLFGDLDNPFAQVVAITRWINTNVLYLSGSTNAQTSAFDTVTEQAGVCRDFAHLGIALCRALTIPARYFTGYAYQLAPADFHACFEAYLGGEWVLFDATGKAPLNGFVKIATGRDAADASIANFFGPVYFKSIKVSCEVAEDNFKPYFYKPGKQEGISYL